MEKGNIYDQWEYTSDWGRNPFDINLTTYGEEGWECFAVMKGNDEQYFFYFKRKKHLL